MTSAVPASAAANAGGAYHHYYGIGDYDPIVLDVPEEDAFAAAYREGSLHHLLTAADYAR